MNIVLFNRKYWLRRFGEQKEFKGYLTSVFTDYVVSIHVHASGTETMQALPEGQRTVRKLEGHGVYPLTAANADTNTKGDMLLYHGDWYECISSVLFEHTILSHYNYLFVKVPTDASRSNDTKNKPEADPNTQKVGDLS